MKFVPKPTNPTTSPPKKPDATFVKNNSTPKKDDSNQGNDAMAKKISELQASSKKWKESYENLKSAPEKTFLSYTLEVWGYAAILSLVLNLFLSLYIGYEHLRFTSLKVQKALVRIDENNNYVINNRFYAHNVEDWFIGKDSLKARSYDSLVRTSPTNQVYDVITIGISSTIGTDSKSLFGHNIVHIQKTK